MKWASLSALAWFVALGTVGFANAEDPAGSLSLTQWVHISEPNGGGETTSVFYGPGDAMSVEGNGSMNNPEGHEYVTMGVRWIWLREGPVVISGNEVTTSVPGGSMDNLSPTISLMVPVGYEDTYYCLVQLYYVNFSDEETEHLLDTQSFVFADN